MHFGLIPDISTKTLKTQMKYLGDSCLMSTRWAYIDTVTVTVSVQCALRQTVMTVSVQCALTLVNWLSQFSVDRYCYIDCPFQCALILCCCDCFSSVCIDTVTLTAQLSVHCVLILRCSDCLHSVCIDTVLWWLSQFSVHWYCYFDCPVQYALILCCGDCQFSVHWYCYIDCPV